MEGQGLGQVGGFRGILHRSRVWGQAWAKGWRHILQQPQVVTQSMQLQ